MWIIVTSRQTPNEASLCTWVWWTTLIIGPDIPEKSCDRRSERAKRILRSEGFYRYDVKVSHGAASVVRIKMSWWIKRRSVWKFKAAQGMTGLSTLPASCCLSSHSFCLKMRLIGQMGFHTFHFEMRPAARWAYRCSWHIIPLICGHCHFYYL